MKFSFIIFNILILISYSSVSFATLETDVLSGKIPSEPSLRSKNYCPECASVTKQSEVLCPPVIDGIVNQTLSRTVYNYIIGKKLLDVCLSSSVKIQLSNEKLDSNLSTILGHEFNVSQNQIEACFDKNDINFEHVQIGKDGAKKVITAYLHTLNRNILDQQLNDLQQISSIDQLLGKKPLENFECDKSFEKACGEIRNCSNPDSVEDISQFTIQALSEVTKLESQYEELNKLQVDGKISFDQKIESLKDINEKINFLNSLMPWMKGDILKKINRPMLILLKQEKNTEAIDTFKKQLTAQLVQTKDLIYSHFHEAGVAQNCLKNNTGCSSRLIDNINDYSIKKYSGNSINLKNFTSKGIESRIIAQEALETELLLSSGECVGHLMTGKKEIDEMSMLAASTGLGLVTGGLGGVLKLGQVALKFYQTGTRLKAAGSLMLLGAEGKSLSRSLSTVANKCQIAVKHLEKASETVDSSCSNKGLSTFKVSQLSSCVVDISLTTLPYLLSLKATGILSSTSNDVKIIAKNIEDQREFFSLKITNPYISSLDREELSLSLSQLKLTSEEGSDIVKKLNDVIKNEKDKNRLKNYINFVLSLKPEEQKMAIEKLHEVALLSGEFNPGGYVQKFYLKENKFYFYEKVKSKILKDKLVAEGKSEVVATKEAELMARDSRSNLQKRYYACQSKTITPELKLAAKRYTGFTIALGVGGSSFGYIKNNLDKLKENKTEFFGKLGYDIAISYVLSKLSAEIMKSPDGSILNRYITANSSSAQVGVIDALVYSKLYGVSEEDARIRVEKITHSKEAMAELKELDQYINKKNMIEEFKNNIIETYKKILSSQNKEVLIGSPPYNLEIENFSSLTIEDLNRPEIKEKLVKAVVLQLNSGGSSALLNTGDKGIDRWINDREWNAVVGIPKGIAVGMTIFQVLCLGADRPVLSLGVASGLQFANQFLSGDGYYKFRKEFIGQ